MERPKKYPRPKKQTIGYLVGAGILVSGLVNSLRMQAITPQGPIIHRFPPSLALSPLSNAVVPIAAPPISTSSLSNRDRQLFRQLLHQAHQEQWFKLQQNEQVQKIGEWFLGRPYQANLLEEQYRKAPISSVDSRTVERRKPSTESLSHLQLSYLQFSQQPELLVASLQTFDCMIFVETVLALSQSAIGVKENVTMVERQATPVSEAALVAAEQSFLKKLEELRYREGVRNNYCSRLHYFSEWLTQQYDRGGLQPIFQKVQSTASLQTAPATNLLGELWQPKLSFMTQHWQRYLALRQSRELRNCIAEKEAQWNLRWSSSSPANRSQTLRYLPTASIAQHYSELQAGDVVGIVTRTPGLDTTHTGFVSIKGNSVGLLHAAPKGGVQRSPDLASYIEQVRDAIGITVSRPATVR